MMDLGPGSVQYERRRTVPILVRPNNGKSWVEWAMLKSGFIGGGLIRSPSKRTIPGVAVTIQA